ncbi:MAG: MBL fold metallo-hydrolase [Oscillospiraceae bacterium]|nr:MBL fold metallo-hydrolase [Oscillospiraceae bacterium]
MRATILTDNIAGAGLCGEWGLSIHIEHSGRRILLDTGASGLFAENAGAMGIDLAAVDHGVLSHAHYDHADGMETFFAVNARAKFLLRAGAAENCFGYHGDSLDYIGIRRGTLERFRDRIQFVSGLYAPYPGAWLLPHTTPGLAALGERAGMYVQEGTPLRRRPDDFSHEQTLVLETSRGLAVFSSCSHGGVMNILREVETAFPGKKILALVGGFHLYQTTEEEVRALGARLRESGVERVVTGHCTGEAAYEILREELPDAEQMRTGLVIDIP